MANQTIKTRIKNKVDTAANWTSNNPTLLKGEIGIESDTGKFKIGDGSTSWTSLGYTAANNTPTLAWNTTSTIGRVNGVDLTVKLPTNPNVNYYHKTGTWSGLTYTAAKVGSPDDLKFTIPTGTSSTTVALGNHTHDVSIATSSGTNELTLAHGTKYALTAGGQSFIFTMPSDNNTHYTTGFYIGAKDEKSNAVTSNGSTYLKLYDDSTRRSQFLIQGTGAATVVSDASGNITISSQDSYQTPLYTTGLQISSANTGALANLYVPVATSSQYGAVKIGYTESGKNYPVELNGSGQMYVNVPWTDNNTVTKVGMVGDTTVSPSSGDIILKAGTNTSLTHQYSSGQNNITINAQDTTYTVATGDSNGQIKITPSSGSAYNVAVKGLGTAAYTASTDYAKKTSGVYYVEGNTTGTTGVWTGSNSDIASYYDGLVVNYKIGIAGASTTTLNINDLGAKTCYLRNTTKITTHYGVGTMILLSYNATTDAFYSTDYDANSDLKAASGNTSSKIFLIGATKQSTSGQTTYSHDTAYVDTDGCLYSNSKKVVTQDTFDSLAQTVDELPTFDYVDGEIATVTAIANGKTKTYVLSYSPADTSCNGNSAFNSNNNSISLTQTHKTCLIDGTIISIPTLKVGDVILVTETDVPDRWVSEVLTTSSGTTVTLLKMETSKVDLSPYSENTHTHSVPAPTITVTGVSYTPAGTVSSGFTGNAATISVSGTPAGTIKTGTGTANYTPAGTVSKPTITVTANTTTIKEVSSVGTLPSLTTTTCNPLASATLTAGTTPPTISFANGVLTIGTGTAPSLSTSAMSSINVVSSWSAGSLPSTKDTTVATGIKSATSTQPSFTGTGTQLLFTGSSLTSTGSYTPSGSVSSAWTGTAATIKPTVTASGTTTGKAST